MQGGGERDRGRATSECLGSPAESWTGAQAPAQGPIQVSRAVPLLPSHLKKVDFLTVLPFCLRLRRNDAKGSR